MYAPSAELRNDNYRSQAEFTIATFERSGIAVFPAGWRRKGSYVQDWPKMALDEAVATTRRDLKKLINVAGRSGNGVAVFDLDAKNAVDPDEMRHVLVRLIGPAIIAIVRTSRGFHLWVQVAESVGNGFCSFIGGEILSEPHLAMLPPSMHPSGQPYAWEVEPRVAESAVNLKALGLVPDKKKHSPGAGTVCTAAPTSDQTEFVELMARAGVVRTGNRSQVLVVCPWHDDRSPSLSINWDAAVFYCFAEGCDARGRIGSLRRLVGVDTPTYRQWRDAAGTSKEETHPSGDKSGCSDLDEATARLSTGLKELGLDELAQSVTDCRAFFRVGKCTSCARTPAFPISCGHPMCIRCMPGRLGADWGRHRASLPAKVNIVLLRPRSITAGTPGVLKSVRSRFVEWRRRADVKAGMYGGRLDRERGAVIMLAIPNDLPVPDSSRAFDVDVVATDRTPSEFLAWLQSQYVEEAQSWESTEELLFMLTETKGRRRFQGFGGIYGEGTQAKEEETMANDETAKSEEKRQPLGRISGGSFKGKREPGGHTCGHCGGAVELYPFTVPAAEVIRTGDHWLWNGLSAGPPEARRHAR